jgi:TrmH family RNA methyltransferase
MRATTITSASNQRIKDAAKLRDRRQRDRQNRFAIDGARELLRALGVGLPLDEAFVCPELCVTPESRQVAAALDAAAVACWQVTPEVFEKLAFGQRRDGVLAIAKSRKPQLAELKLASGGLIGVMAGLEKPGNVGAVLRSADAAGVAAVIVADPHTDLFNPNCIRASLGTIFTMPVAQATAAEALAWLRARGVRMLAARVDAEQLYSEVDWHGDVAVVLGSEAAGLSDEWHASDVRPIKLPMCGAADSLNVSATAAVLFYEALRQRGSA